VRIALLGKSFIVVMSWLSTARLQARVVDRRTDGMDVQEVVRGQYEQPGEAGGPSIALGPQPLIATA
jgi:hypothetical protein